MYLKSLSLRGFKSFADKTYMLFDPGLTVVVGPNGSGKSNISDAILWVLGEQSAKMLRGQAMEDVIFSGSSARQPVGMAEVTIVLDNSDGTLPVDYEEVSVTRRMYRSGESEYLINGTTCRLMDVTEILHDSGLGREMHSIISQGNLDSILSSRPEERRELIEEAAGISKHRRRKIRSERKLRSMDENLTRAKDINREIQRQLRPLERQVGKAREARELQERLREASLTLAVDDLRRLQVRHGTLATQVNEAQAAVSLSRLKLDERTGELERYQSLLEEKGIFVGDLGAQRTRLQDQLARIEADWRLLGEKGRGMQARMADQRNNAAAAERDHAQVKDELERVSLELQDARAKWEELKRQVDELVPRARKTKGMRKDLGRRLAQAQADQRAAQRRADQETLAHAKLRDQVGNAQVEDELFANRLRQLDDQVETCEERLLERRARKQELSASIETAMGEANAARDEVRSLEQALRQARADEQQARERLTAQRASLSALKSVDEQAEQSSPMVATLMRHMSVSDKVDCRLADVIEAPKELESLVERLLGDDLMALVVRTADDASDIVDVALQETKSSGKATMLRRDVPARTLDEPDVCGEPLLSKISARPGAEALVQALLGDVRLVDSAADAMRAHDANPALTSLTPPCVVSLPDGRVVVGSDAGQERGSLERKRRMRALQAGMGDLENRLEEASERVARCDGQIAAARDKSARAKGEAARLQGELSSVTSEMGRLESQRSSATAERSRVERQRQEAASKAADARKAIEEHREAAERASLEADELGTLVDSLMDERSEASRAEGEAERALSDARLKLATVQERKNHLIVREDELTARLARLARTVEVATQDANELSLKIRRIGPLDQAYASLSERARAWQRRLDDRASLAEADSASLKDTIGEARGAVSKARGTLEQAQSALNELLVEQGKIEVQVEQAVAAIEESGAQVAEALAIPEPQDRRALEVEVVQIKERLGALGPVNEVAMEEYTRLKQRADYIAEQVSDLESARKSLAKITAAIERKMRRQFLIVFDQVNANFTEVFGLLFPGGQAHLEMTDPDHLSQTGIEIIAQPRGKKLQKMMLMSGGEKSLTALALLFAVYKTRTVPFYVFDEVEAALDDANLGKLLFAIEQLRQTTQLIVISHQRRTMEQADVLYGVSMQADGVSHVVSQRLDKTGKVVKG
ncbi:MAG: chromosome segregation protein SMC [Coriobacteriales bacterium]|nr:chromosome segregation protein SMC [Coriobacteriales bacterium]